MSELPERITKIVRGNPDRIDAEAVFKVADVWDAGSVLKAIEALDNAEVPDRGAVVAQITYDDGYTLFIMEHGSALVSPEALRELQAI